MLVLLDLTPKPDWIRNIRDSMWADHIPAPAPDQRGRWAVVVLAIMKPLTEQEIRAAFVNCTKGEAKRLSVPRDLADRPWDDLDYLGWRDP